MRDTNMACCINIRIRPITCHHSCKYDGWLSTSRVAQTPLGFPWINFPKFPTWSSSVVRTSVFGRRTFPNLCLIYADRWPLGGLTIHYVSANSAFHPWVQSPSMRAWAVA